MVLLENVKEIFHENGYETGKLCIEWSKTSGGDEINEFTVECASGSFLVRDYVPFVSGQNRYEHNTTKLIQGGSVFVTIYAANSVGNSSIYPYKFNTGKVRIFYTTCTVLEFNL